MPSTKGNIEKKYIYGKPLSVNRISLPAFINQINGKCVVMKHDHVLSAEEKDHNGIRKCLTLVRGA